MLKRILSVIGARPQFIKASIVSLRISQCHIYEEFSVHTGQHYDANMSDIFFSELGLKNPQINLGIGSGSHGAQTGQMLEALERTMIDMRPDIVLVYGDTNSTMAGALAAVKLHIPVAHVESGLRSYNREMPEEINRIVTDHVSDLLFAPTDTAVSNLLAEGIGRKKIHLVGDVMYDVAMKYGEIADKRSDVLSRYGVKSKDYVLATIHRAENTDNPQRLSGIWRGLQVISKHQRVIMPIHPRTRKMLESAAIGIHSCAGVRVVEPVGYLDMVMLEKNASVIITDSGGVQKEAYFHRVPCITLRDETEWVELVKQGYNQLVGTDPIDISKAYKLAESKTVSDTNIDLYGKGNAAELLVNVLEKFSETFSAPGRE
jgi:UDP-GlcNAc3NAcA epimerase